MSNTERQIVPAGATHQHYKGGFYRFVTLGVDSETLQEVVLYEHIAPHKPGYWSRPAHLFFGLMADGSARFKRLV